MRGLLRRGHAGLPRRPLPLAARPARAAGRGLAGLRREGGGARQARHALRLLEHGRDAAPPGHGSALPIHSLLPRPARGARLGLLPRRVVAHGGGRGRRGRLARAVGVRRARAGHLPLRRADARGRGAPLHRPHRPPPAAAAVEPGRAAVPLGLRERGRRARRHPRLPGPRPSAGLRVPRYRLHGGLQGLDVGPLPLPGPRGPGARGGRAGREAGHHHRPGGEGRAGLRRL